MLSTTNMHDDTVRSLMRILMWYSLVMVVYNLFMFYWSRTLTWGPHAGWPRSWADSTWEVLSLAEAGLYLIAAVAIRYCPRPGRYVFVVAAILSSLVLLSPVQIVTEVEGSRAGTVSLYFVPFLRWAINVTLRHSLRLFVQIGGIIFCTRPSLDRWFKEKRMW